MEISKKHIGIFLEKYSESIQAAASEKEYWYFICECLFNEKIIDEESCDIIKNLLSESALSVYISQRIMDVNEKEKKLKKLLDKIYDTARLGRERKHVNERCAKRDASSRFFLMFTKIYGENADKFVDVFYKEVIKHLIIVSICEDKYKLLKEMLEEACYYRRYGNKMTLEGGYYCQSATRDLTIGNVKRGRIVKKKPQNLSDKVEYIYDEKGNLLAYRWYVEDEKLYACNFLLYANEFVIDVEYSRKSTFIETTCVRKYVNDRIKLLEMVYHELENDYFYVGYLYKMIREEYIYSTEDVLNKCVEEVYDFPRIHQYYGESRGYKESHDILNRSEHVFFKDDDERLTGCLSRRLVGENAIRSWNCEFSESKKKITGKESGRWKRPNCFVAL